MASRVRGVGSLRREIKAMGLDVADRAIEPIRKHTREMRAEVMDRLASYDDFHHGQRGVQSRTGRLRRFYRSSTSRAALSGRVGLLSSRAQREAGIQARALFYGTATQPARPAHDEVFELHEHVYIADQEAVLRDILRRFGR
ncbi:MAG: hypothetical protein AAF092_05125 [Pseudomonadota bacterium]